MLDYEDDDYRPGIKLKVYYFKLNFTTKAKVLQNYYMNKLLMAVTLQAVAIDRHDNNHIGEAIININLINWNDELPIFDEDAYSVTFEETVGDGFHVGKYRATDRDVDDKVE